MSLATYNTCFKGEMQAKTKKKTNKTCIEKPDSL